MKNFVEGLREAVHELTDEADEKLLLCMISAPMAVRQHRENNEEEKTPSILEKGPFRYSEQQLAELREASEAYGRGDLPTYTEEEFWQRIKANTGYQRKKRNAD